MDNVFHILNGDSLSKILPPNILGQKYICRECLVDGNVEGNTLDELFRNRATFISSYFSEKDFDLSEYKFSSGEFYKILDIPEKSEINLWFEEDLFCQVNLWFILYLLKSTSRTYQINLVLPHKDFKYSFYGMSSKLFENSFENKIEIIDFDFNILSKFWQLFQQSNYSEVYKLVHKLGSKYQFIIPALDAWKENRVEKVLKDILKNTNLTKFEDIFKEFHKRESVYGFGDLQIKKALREIDHENLS